MMKYSLNIDMFWILLPSIIQGAGMGLVFSPLSQLAYSTLSKQDAVSGAVVFNLFRTIGGSFGISIVNTYFSRMEQKEWNSLGGDLTLSNPILQQAAHSQGHQITDPSFLVQIQALLHQQSTMMAFVSTFGFILVSYLLLIPFIALFKKKRHITNNHYN